MKLTIFQLDKLRKLAFEKKYVTRDTAKGKIQVEALKIHFPCASLHLVKKSGILGMLNDSKYLSKPVVAVEKNALLFGELAILRYLERDHWKGVWVDSLHSRGGNETLWSDMPPHGAASPLPPNVLSKFNAIKEKNNGTLDGFFDIFAWKGDGYDYRFIEYKEKDESPNDSEISWINAAISEGIRPEQLCIVGYDLPI